MNSTVNIDVDPQTREALAGLSLGDLEVLGEALELREGAREGSGLDPRSFALVKIAALVALDSPPASYLVYRCAGRGHSAGQTAPPQPAWPLATSSAFPSRRPPSSTPSISRSTARSS